VSASGGDPGGQQTLTQADNGKTIMAEPGSRVVVVLPENPTTGYSWTPEAVDPDLPLLSSEYSTAHGGGIGGGGTRTLEFQAKSPGDHRIRLKRWREWEGDKSVRERYQVGVRITAG
jgi:inhibitor of cysteine peptidase